MASNKNKLTHEEFFKMAIVKLRNVSKSPGIHTVFSGFNEAFRQHFGEDPIAVTQGLARSGKIDLRPVKGGVMIYLPGEGPVPRDKLGKRALSKILDQPEDNEGLVERVIAQVVPEGRKTFPDDFVSSGCGCSEVALPGTVLQLDTHSQTLVISPKRHFRYEARNPSEAKYLVYANTAGMKKLSVPKDNKVLFDAVANYERYCQEIRARSFNLLLESTHDEAAAELFCKEVGIRLGLRAPASAPNP